MEAARFGRLNESDVFSSSFAVARVLLFEHVRDTFWDKVADRQYWRNTLLNTGFLAQSVIKTCLVQTVTAQQIVD